MRIGRNLTFLRDVWQSDVTGATIAKKNPGKHWLEKLPAV